MEVRVERAADERDGAPDAGRVGAPGSPVQEDGGAVVGYGSASRISAACSSLPVIQYRVSSFV